MDTIYKTYRAEVKGVNPEDGTVDMFIPVSTDSVDRDGEVVEPTAFKKTIPKFMKRPVLVASHDYKDLTNQIGEWTRFKITENGIEGKPKYYINDGNPQADWGFKLAQKGMAAFSIGFIPTKWEDGATEKEPRRTYKEVELLEVSQVIVPSNREAIQSVRSKSADPVVKTLIDDIVNAEIVDLTEIPKEGTQIPDSVTKPEETVAIVKKPTQEEIKDEIDYLYELIKEAGLSDDTLAKADALVSQIRSYDKRLPGGDIPVDIEKQEAETKNAVKTIVGQSVIEIEQAKEAEKQKAVIIARMVSQTLVDETEELERKRLSVFRRIITSNLDTK